jgi:hypothetical protein
MPATSTRPRSVVQWDSSLKTNTRRIYGYQPYCACGWEGKAWATHREAQLERSFHQCDPERAG